MAKQDIFKMPVHPAADAFPMMPEDEIDELAADIEANGLQQPLVVCGVDGETLLLDGRNRREACKRRGITPETVEFTGDDPVIYLLSANVNRRHMNKGQRAMVVAKLLESNNTSQSEAASLAGMTQGRISHARTVLKYAPELADAVIAGKARLDDAYREAKARKDSAWTPEQAKMRADLQAGKTVVINLDKDAHVVQWARSEGLLVEIDRRTQWGNPFVLEDDGTRAEVIHKYATYYLPHKNKLMAEIAALKGKALGCHCAPDACHGDVLAGLADES